MYSIDLFRDLFNFNVRFYLFIYFVFPPFVFTCTCFVFYPSLTFPVFLVNGKSYYWCIKLWQHESHFCGRKETDLERFQLKSGKKMGCRFINNSEKGGFKRKFAGMLIKLVLKQYSKKGIGRTSDNNAKLVI